MLALAILDTVIINKYAISKSSAMIFLASFENLILSLRFNIPMSYIFLNERLIIFLEHRWYFELGCENAANRLLIKTVFQLTFSFENRLGLSGHFFEHLNQSDVNGFDPVHA